MGKGQSHESHQDLPLAVQDWGSKDVRSFFRDHGVRLRGVDGPQLQSWHAHGVLQERTAPQGCDKCTNGSKHVQACEELLRDYLLDEYSPRADAAECALLATLEEINQHDFTEESDDQSERMLAEEDGASAAVEALKLKLASMEAELAKGEAREKELKAAATSAEVSHQAATSKVAKLEAALTSLKQQQSSELEAVQQKAEDRGVAATSAESARKAAVKRADALEAQLQSVQAAMEAELAAQTAKGEAREKELKEAATSAQASHQAASIKVAKLEAALTSLQQQQSSELESIQHEAEDKEVAAASAEAARKAAVKKADALEAQLQSLQAKMETELAAQTAKAEAREKELNATATSAQASHQAATIKVAKLEAALTSLQQQQSSELESIQQRADDKEVAAASAEAARKAAVTRADALEEQLQSLQATMSDASASAEASRQAALDRVKALEEALASLQQKSAASEAALAKKCSKSKVAAPASMPANKAATEAACKAGTADISNTKVSVVAPGGGTGMNASAYATIARMQGLSIKVLGQSRAPYDRYPLSWGASNQGFPAPNLESFAMELASQGCIQQTDCLVVGSRGGQVVLPTLWKVLGEQVPPTVIMNGGCAMGLPVEVQWPSSAVTFLLLGGQDYFRSGQSPAAYFADAQRRVPNANTTTAILFVNEMSHMPQSQLLTAVLPHMIFAVRSWKAHGSIPMNELATIVSNARKGGFHGKLSYKTGTDAWETSAFP